MTDSSSPALERAATAPAVVQRGLGSLRAFVTVLVLAHHALLAYHPFAPPVGPSLTAMPFWRAFPVVDAQRWSGATWIVGWNDTFFMALMFLLSGLFVWPSLRRKGARRFARDRALRLGLPLLVAWLVLAPLAYVPSYLQTGAAASWSGFWAQWMAIDGWPTGPAWFLALLLVFDAVAVAVFAVIRRFRWQLPRVLKLQARSPLTLFALLFGLSLLAYLPMVNAYGPMRWTELGPLTFQTSRLFYYAVYFALGLALGAAHAVAPASATTGTTTGAAGTLSPRGPLAARWAAWSALAALVCWANIAAVTRAMMAGGLSERANLVAACTFVAASAAISLAMLALFLRFGNARSAVRESLARNAYGMYVLHYPIVSWLQYALLPSPWPGYAKAAVVFTTTVALSWLLSAGLRRARR